MTHRAVIISITPEFAGKIASGSKTVELRRRFPRVPPGTWIFLYETMPTGAVTGRVKVADIDSDQPSVLWQRYSEKTGLCKQRFDEYFRERERGVAVQVVSYEAIEPKSLPDLKRALNGFVAPQSYRFLSVQDQSAMLLSKKKVVKRTVNAPPGVSQ